MTHHKESIEARGDETGGGSIFYAEKTEDGAGIVE